MNLTIRAMTDAEIKSAIRHTIFNNQWAARLNELLKERNRRRRKGIVITESQPELAPRP